jgi:ABC-type transport system involved in cytochrome bd biosynthesis fused ATPase/permease subunit
MHWRYATINHRLVDSDLDPILIRLVARRYLIVIFMLMIAIVVSFENINASLLLYIATPLYNLVLIKKHKLWFWSTKKR